MNIFILLCGGIGQRCNTSIPKQYIKINNKPVFQYALDSAILSNLFSKYIIVCETSMFEKKFPNILDSQGNITLVEKGKTRQESVFNALNSIKSDDKKDMVFIHDSCRPYIKSSFLICLYQIAAKEKSAIPFKFETNAVYLLDKHEYVDKKAVYLLETPQVFLLSEILKAHKMAIKDNIVDAQDDGSLYQKYIGNAFFVENKEINNKITMENDLKEFKNCINESKRHC